MEIVSSDLQLIWEDFCLHLRDYPTSPSDLRNLWGKFVRLMGMLSEERARLKQKLAKADLDKDPKAYLESIRQMALKGTSYDERRLLLQFGLPPDQRQAVAELESVESMIDSMYRVERVLKGYYRVMMLDMKLSFEGHE